MRRAARILCIVGGLIVVAWLLTRPATPDDFYTADPGPGAPGSALRHEAFTRGVPVGARAWRLLYTTTIATGAPAVASAVVMTSTARASRPRPVIAWTHGTTGIARGCAPSLLDDPFANVPALGPMLDEGWAYVATDYVGQGTPGPHPYLIGEGQGRSALDAIRAARRVAEFGLGSSTVVWGHSQGGHAALWTGILAPTYAPDVVLEGVAAVAPATDLPAMLEAVQSTTVGRIMSAYVLHAYAARYPDVSVDEYVSPWTRPLVRDIAGRCLAGRQALFSVAEALAIRGAVFSRPPTTGAFGRRLTENVPARPLPQPTLIVQGLADDLVVPEIQRAFVRGRCAAGQVIDARFYVGEDHLSIVGAESPLTNALMDWTRSRFAGQPPPTTCRESTVP